MDNIINEILTIIDNDFRAEFKSYGMEFTKTSKEKISDLLKNNLIEKREMRQIAFDTPNDNDLGNKIRSMFILGE
jgi:hypothetical protein